MIGTQNESSLHASLKEYFREPGDILEGWVDGCLIDLVKPGLLVEVQTGNFSSFKGKLSKLLKDHRVQVVHPISARRQLIKLAPETGEILSSRRSPKRGTFYHLFAELVHIPQFLLHPNFTVEAVLVADEEIRCADGKGSWRRGGVSILDRKLVEVLETRVFQTREDYAALLPKELSGEFTNRELAEAAGISLSLARKMTYTLRGAGVLQEVGKRGREIVHRLT